MQVERHSLTAQFERFKANVKTASNGIGFRSFHEGLPAEWESYKPRVRAKALSILKFHAWEEGEVGQGTILERLIEAIEIDDPECRNNLVRWENRYGHASRSHRALLDARSRPACARIEKAIFELYTRRATEEDVYEALRALVGSRYDLLAYLFFLWDDQRFMPIAPRTFDQAFALLGVDLVTTRKCSWENYTAYNDVLREIHLGLWELVGKDVRLIDAHSFCWMLIKLDEPQAAAVGKKFDPLAASVLAGPQRRANREGRTGAASGENTETQRAAHAAPAACRAHQATA